MKKKVNNDQPITKTYLIQQLRKYTGEISKFLEEKVLEPIFDLKEDVSGLKEDVSGLKEDMIRVERKLDISLEKSVDHDRRIGICQRKIKLLEDQKYT
ncbi:MAG TPA: hypothetical protein VMW41_03795 [Candidatus Bathyarchaeia archaeon]|nr:hypothetical protein [Candidatus Bathyarchaeia archaeon]